MLTVPVTEVHYQQLRCRLGKESRAVWISSRALCVDCLKCCNNKCPNNLCFSCKCKEQILCDLKMCLFASNCTNVGYYLLIPQSFDWLAAFHLQLLQATRSIAVCLSAAVFLVTCFDYCSTGLPTAFFPNIAPSIMFSANSLCLTLCHIHEWRLFL